MARKDEFTIRVDTHVSKAIHELRLVMGLSREQVAIKIGVTHQQLQKYEKGKNRISGGRIAAIAMALGKPVGFFFAGIHEEPREIPTEHQTMAIEVSRNFMRIKNPMHQISISRHIRELADAQ